MLNRRHFDKTENCYEVRLSPESRARLWWYGVGARGNWVFQIVDNEGNQIDDAEYYANKRVLPERITALFA